VIRQYSDWMTGVRLPVGAGSFSLYYHVRTNSGAHPASHPMGAGCFFLGVERLRCEADKSPPFSAEVKKWSCILLPHASSYFGCLVQYRIRLAWYLVPTRTTLLLPSPYDL